ncbi:hypothetical protein GR198_01175 [Rhizobium leguminosarum]|nr:hypothetical protein [Rhizobium leguminosarum]
MLRRFGLAETGRLIDHPTPFEPTECFNLTRKGSREARLVSGRGRLIQKLFEIRLTDGFKRWVSGFADVASRQGGGAISHSMSSARPAD